MSHIYGDTDVGWKKAKAPNFLTTYKSKFIVEENLKETLISVKYYKNHDYEQ